MYIIRILLFTVHYLILSVVFTVIYISIMNATHAIGRLSVVL